MDGDFFFLAYAATLNGGRERGRVVPSRCAGDKKRGRERENPRHRNLSSESTTRTSDISLSLSLHFLPLAEDGRGRTRVLCVGDDVRKGRGGLLGKPCLLGAVTGQRGSCLVKAFWLGKVDKLSMVTTTTTMGKGFLYRLPPPFPFPPGSPKPGTLRGGSGRNQTPVYSVRSLRSEHGVRRYYEVGSACPRQKLIFRPTTSYRRREALDMYGVLCRD